MTLSLIIGDLLLKIRIDLELLNSLLLQLLVPGVDVGIQADVLLPLPSHVSLQAILSLLEDGVCLLIYSLLRSSILLQHQQVACLEFLQLSVRKKSILRLIVHGDPV